MDVKSLTLAELARRWPGVAAGLEFHGLKADGRTVADAAAELGMCGCELSGALAAAQAGAGPWGLSAADLIDDILATHHARLRQWLPAGSNLLARAVASAREPEKVEAMLDLHEQLRAELEMHLAKEEQILFPMIRELEATGRITVGCGHLDGPITQMEHEHEAAKQALRGFKRMRAEGLLASAGVEANLAAQVEQHLTRLHDDLVLHIYKENRVLFPQALGAVEAHGG
ncbi:MAG: Iron-sulfur cluster repair protein YtfE [Phycisphaerae bacterium]|nr:Iron-sulfur cluster repair protein YtfE [Phycisphaerae bacterium]